MAEITATKRPIQSSNRVVKALLVAAKGFAITVAKTLYALWLEATGLVFAVLTVTGASDLIRHRADNLAHHGRFATVIAFTLVCAWFTVVSFVRAKRTRR